MTHGELQSLVGLLREVLVLNPIERKSAGELAEQGWLSDRSRESDLKRSSQPLMADSGQPTFLMRSNENAQTERAGKRSRASPPVYRAATYYGIVQEPTNC